MLGEDEFTLTWRLDLPPVGRARSRSPLNFDRWANSMVLKGSIAYERLRVMKQFIVSGMIEIKYSIFNIGIRTRYVEKWETGDNSIYISSCTRNA